MRVLVVEPEGTLRAQIKGAVELLGHECLPADSGLRGWQIFQEHGGCEVVISRQSMPDIGGGELFEMIRAVRPNRAPRFIALSEPQRALREEIKNSADDVLGLPIHIDEVEMRLRTAHSIGHLSGRLTRREQELSELNDRMRRSAGADPITGLADEFRLNEDLAVLDARAIRHDQPYCVGLLEIDRFDLYRDNFGAEAGEKLLKRFSSVIESRLRRDDSLYRLKTDRFGCIFAHQDLEGATRALGRVLADIRNLAIAHPGNRPSETVTASVGISGRRRGQQIPARKTLALAQQALFRAKQAGKDRFEVLLTA